MTSEIPFAEKEDAFFIVRYGELGLKSRPVRNRFLRKLASNIEDTFLDRDTDCYIDVPGPRLYVYPGDFRIARKILSTAFGVVSFSPAVRIGTSSLDRVIRKGTEYSQWLLKDGRSFAVRTRRVGQHDYGSQDVNVELGAEILKSNEEKGLSVDLTNPDETIYLEIRQDKTYFYHRVIRGPGGLPYGVSGSSVCAVAGPKSLLSAYLMMKRGNRLVFYYTPGIYEEDIGPDRIGEFLGSYIPSPDIRMPKDISPDNFIRRLGEECVGEGCEGIVLGFDLPTFEMMLKDGCIPKARQPLFYPVVGFTEEEVRERGRRIFGSNIAGEYLG